MDHRSIHHPPGGAMANSQPRSPAVLKAVPPTSAKPAAPKGRKPAAPKPPKEPTINLGATTVTVWKPTVTLPTGRKLQCPHQPYGHESEAAGRKCARTL